MAIPAIDAFLVHQAYLEGYKNGLAEENESCLEEIAAAIIIALNRLGVERLSDLNKRDYSKFVAEVNRIAAKIFGRYPGLTLENIRTFIKTETRVYATMFAGLEYKPLPPLNPDKLLTDTINAPVAGLGETVAALLSTTLASVIADIRKSLTRAQSDKLTIAETIRALVGSKSLKFKDGLIPKMARRVTAAIDTMVQHASAFLGHNLGRLVSDDYQWVSVLDSGTTDICRSRNGNIYQYATGPRPPAHYRCRSTTIPVLSTVPAPVPTYFGWLRTQPTAILVDILGATRANAFERGNLSASDLGSFGGIKSLSLAEYRAKLFNLMGSK